MVHLSNNFKTAAYLSLQATKVLTEMKKHANTLWLHQAAKSLDSTTKAIRLNAFTSDISNQETGCHKYYVTSTYSEL